MEAGSGGPRCKKEHLVLSLSRAAALSGADLLREALAVSRNQTPGRL